MSPAPHAASHRIGGAPVPSAVSAAGTGSEAPTAVVLRGVGPERARCEGELLGAGLPLPLAHRIAAADVAPWRDSWFVAVRDATGRCGGGFAVHARAPRLVPGHRVLRVERFGPAVPQALQEAALQALAEQVQQDARVLRLDIEVFSRDAQARAAAGEVLTRLGFVRLEPANNYTRTLLLDLRSDEEAVLAGFHRSARRNIREAAAHPVEVAPVQDPQYIPRMDALLRETLARTGGRYVPQDWLGRLRLSESRPDLSRVVGLFLQERTGSESLVAFAWGCCNGDHVQYCEAASTRLQNSRLSLAYPLVWDLVQWARRNGATWFDLGGVTMGNQDDPNDPLGGISDFKRYFSRDLATVMEEWTFQPRRLRARIASGAHRRLQSVLAASAGFRLRLAPRAPPP